MLDPLQEFMESWANTRAGRWPTPDVSAIKLTSQSEYILLRKRFLSSCRLESTQSLYLFGVQAFFEFINGLLQSNVRLQLGDSADH